MSDDQDQSEKTEDPTDKKLKDAREKGQVPKSKELNTWLIMGTSTLIVMVLGPYIASGIGRELTVFIAQPHAIDPDFGNLRRVLVDLLKDVGWALALAALLLMITAAGAGLVQHGPVFSFHSIKPDFSKLSLIKGFKRQFSLKQFVEFLKGILKMVVVGSIGYMVIAPNFDSLPLLIQTETGAAFDHLYELALLLMGGVLGAAAVLAAADLMYQRYEFTKQQRMSRRDIKDEHKQSEGDPMVKARLRSIRMEKARQRMMAAVPDADVVVTNPTHFAVALKYSESDMEAPVVVAKGADFIAQRIREVAQENDVPIVENPPLARTLFLVDLDQAIPEATFKAVAQVISYVWKLKGHRRAKRARKPA
jgi:flagellar biosynthetic protein FlhB